MPTIAQLFRQKLAKSFGTGAPLSKRFKMAKPRVPSEPEAPRGKLVPQREIEEKISREHGMYGNDEENQKRAMDIAKLKIMRENAVRQAIDPEPKGVRRAGIDEFTTDRCDNVF